MSSALFDLSVPVYIKCLESLSAFLKKGEQWAVDNNVPKQTLLDGKIADDMKPLPFQIQTCSNTAKFVAVRLGGLENEVWADDETTFEQLYERIAKTVVFLKKTDAKAFAGAESKELTLFGKFELTGMSYLQTFATPNFFFHMTMAYAVLRKAGAPVGKFDFLGNP
ncbi:hypothetical protein LTR08_004710 [Meristemomyces frigidus]|nr:hypothetical protein LTR08_004710 [Meristemomyces frigidus]